MSDVKLGELISDPLACRDAIHVAVVPMKAAEILRPGQRVGIVSEGIAGPSGSIIGIVDPYLTDVVPAGKSFWLFLLPNTVTGMRHHWSHPAFVETAPESELDKERSIAWLKDAAMKLGLDYDELIAEGNELETGDYINNGETIRDRWYRLKDEFWEHHKIVTGRDIPEDERGGFTCYC